MASVGYKGQNYEEIKRQCKREGVLFEDPEFPAVDASLFFSRKPPRPFVWKRPKEIEDDPKLYVGGASRFDITQGMLGDCWLLAAVASLAQREELLQHVIPPGQNFDEGIVRFRFWQYGKWTEVCVDDRLPTYNNQLVFLHSPEKREFWCALLEKAYAKLCGSYESLKGGQTSEAMEDFTGGLTETFDLAKSPENFFKIMQKAAARGCLMGCSIEAKPNEIEAKLSNGLVKGHAYSITGATKVSYHGRDVELVRVRNPWGNEREWNGSWGDKSAEWRAISDAEKRGLGLTFADDGEFWMSYGDFKSNFTKVEICNLGPDSATADGKTKWEAQTMSGSWRRAVSAGGCRNFPNTFHTNPQFRIKLEDPDDDDEEDNCTLVISVIQKERRKKKKLGVQNLTMGFAIYKITDEHANDVVLSKEFFLYNKSTARSASFINAREVTGRFSLPPAEYTIVPSTFDPNQEGDFLIRLFSEKPRSPAISLGVKTNYVAPTRVRPSADEHAALDSKFKQFFDNLAGKDDSIDAFELQQILSTAMKKELGGQEFNLATCRTLISMMDEDESGKIEFKEFKETWLYVREIKKVFGEYDKDNNNMMDLYELRDALKKLGFVLSNRILSSIGSRFASKKSSIPLDDFMQIAARLKRSFAEYQEHKGRFTLDSFLNFCGAI